MSRRAPLLILLLVVGCQSTPKAPEEAPAQAPGAARVELSGAGLELGEARDALAPDALLQRFAALLREGRERSAQRLIERFPDVAEELLRESAASDDVLLRLAALRDLHAANGGLWQTALQRRALERAAAAAWIAMRREARGLLRLGRFEAAAELDLPGAAAGLALATELDARQLHGQLLLLAGRDEEAARVLAAAVELADGQDPALAAGFGLLASEALRRAGLSGESQRAWREAVTRGASLLRGARPPLAPRFWERAAYLRPVDLTWPEAVPEAVGAWLAAHGQVPGFEARLSGDEPAAAAALVQALIGVLRLRRGASQAALLAFTRAEVPLRARNPREGLQLMQARALVDLGQSDAALGVLTPLAVRAGDAVRPPALALLGVVSVERGQLRRGLALLTRALEAEAAWPGRAGAQADLGLTLLMLGEEADGLRWLDLAASAFRSAGDDDQLAQCLRNRLRYRQARGDGAEVELLRGELAALERVF